MKKLFCAAVLSLCALVSLSAFAGEYDFRKTTWGMSRTDVIAAEGKDPLKSGENVEGLEYSIYKVNLPISKEKTFEALAIYYFVEGQLFFGRYNFIHSHSNKNDFLDDFDDVVAVISQIYGEPSNTEAIWKDDLYKDDSNDWGMAIMVGDLEKYTYWETDTTSIKLQLKGDNHKANFAVLYDNKDEQLQALVKQNETKEQKSTF